MLSLLEKLSDKLSKLGAYLASVLFLMLVALIMTEIIGRTFFDYSTMIADEYSGYFYLAAVFLGLAYTFRQGAHIRITLLSARFSHNVQRYIDIFAGIMMSSILGFALYYAWFFMLDSKQMEMLSENVSETPLYLTQIPMVIGLAFFTLASIAFTLKKVLQ
jgi:TRAP-type transport system small permease protein